MRRSSLPLRTRFAVGAVVLCFLFAPLFRTALTNAEDEVRREPPVPPAVGEREVADDDENTAAGDGVPLPPAQLGKSDDRSGASESSDRPPPAADESTMEVDERATVLDEPEPVDPAVIAAQVQELVSKLASPHFDIREQATHELVKLGPAALEPIRNANQVAQAEVRFRCDYAISAIEYNERFGRLEAFAADINGKEGIVIPGWDRFREIVGEGKESRKLFVDMHRSDGELIELSVEEPAAAAKICQQRCVNLQRTMHLRRNNLPTASIATMLFLVSGDHLADNDQVAVSLYSLCNHTYFRKELQSGSQKQEFMRLLGAFIASGGERNSLYYRLMLAMRYDIEEGLVPAKRILTQGGMPQHYKQYAVLTIAKLGDKNNQEHIDLLNSLLNDKTVCSTHQTRVNGNRKVYQTQIRDVALAALVHLHGLDLKKYGFPRASRNSYYLYNTGTLGFHDDAERDAAFKIWQERDADAADSEGGDSPTDSDEAETEEADSADDDQG